ncbi:hypothetical protein [Salinimicrobium sp. GXAS 041]|uniref:hypothetical protein n=1 Tax=Salinimicrobium sp. GXAS 041 TaxID=3400806 RepID=UPI003C7148FD
MEITATVLLFAGAVLGFMAFTHLSMNMSVPKMIWLSHVVLVALGLLALIINAFTTDSMEKHYNLMVIFAIALIPALTMFAKKDITTRKALAIVYGLTGFFGLFWLITYVLP